MIFCLLALSPDPRKVPFVFCLGVEPELLHPSLQSAPSTTENLGASGKSGSAGITIFGSIGANFTASGNVGEFAALAAIFKGTLFILLGFIPAFTSVSTDGSGTGWVLAIPYPFRFALEFEAADLGLLDLGNNE